MGEYAQSYCWSSSVEGALKGQAGGTMSVIPYVVEQTVHGERGYDIYSRLLKDRIVFLGGEIDTQVSNLIVAEMLYLTAENGTKDIYLYINRVGGEVTPGMAMYDTMQYINCRLYTSDAADDLLWVDV